MATRPTYTVIHQGPLSALELKKGWEFSSNGSPMRHYGQLLMVSGTGRTDQATTASGHDMFVKLLVGGNEIIVDEAGEPVKNCERVAGESYSYVRPRVHCEKAFNKKRLTFPTVFAPLDLETDAGSGPSWRLRLAPSKHCIIDEMDVWNITFIDF